MSPWLWLLWGVVALVVLFVASAAFAAVWEAMRESKAKSVPCARCGFDASREDVRRELN